MHRPGKSVFIALIPFLLAIIGIWLWFIPKGYFGITSTIGYTFCHQDPARSPHAFGHSLALCYRCMGLFSGILIGALWQIGQGKNARFTSKPILVFGGLTLLFYVFDGLNASFLPELLSLKPLYQDRAWIRMLSGLLLGNAVAMVVIPLFNRVFFVNYNETPPAEGIFRKFGIAVSDGLILFFFLMAWNC